MHECSKIWDVGNNLASQDHSLVATHTRDAMRNGDRLCERVRM